MCIRDRAKDRERQQVDALPAAKVVSGDAGKKSQHDERHANPRAPAQTGDGANETGIAACQSLERQVGATRDENGRACPCTDDFGCRTARPGAIVVGPQATVAVNGLHRTQRSGQELSLIHI